MTNKAVQSADFHLRMVEVAKDRRDGLAWDEIAAKYGYTTPRAVQKDLSTWLQAESVELKEVIRNDVTERLFKMFDFYYKMALEGNINAAYLVRDLAKQIMVLHGVQPPAVIDHSTTNHNNTMIILPGKDELPPYVSGEVIDA